MGNKKKKYGPKPYLKEDAVQNTIFLEEINKNPIKKKFKKASNPFDEMDTNDAKGRSV